MIGSIFSGKQYTIGDLMQIDAVRQNKSTGCKVVLEDIYHEVKKETLIDKLKSFLGMSTVAMYYITLKLSVISTSGKTYTVYIQTPPDFSLVNWQGNKIKIYCSCPDFKYRSAYLLNSRKSLFLTPTLKSSLGRALTEAPKRDTTFLCKHAFAAVRWVVKNWSMIMKKV